MTDERQLIPDLFRKEFSKMIAVISKLYGLQHIEIAEDIVSETFLTATENWAQKGIPANPTAWLYTVAKQKTLYHFRRKKIFDEKNHSTNKIISRRHYRNEGHGFLNTKYQRQSIANDVRYL